MRRTALAADGVVARGYRAVRVLDRAALEGRVCECYAVVKNEYDRLLPHRLSE